MLPELSDQLIHNFRLEGLRGQAPKQELHGRRHHRQECVKVLGLLSVAEGSDPHRPWQVTPHP
jgi:hypothetical protein